MKLAIAGKGGVGKSTVAGALSLLLARRGRRVLAIDADPDANLAGALGLPEELRAEVVPIASHRALIEERTGAKVREYGQMFKLNPEVSDIADEFAVEHDGVALLVLGAIEAGGSGCACPENVLVRSLLSELVLHRDETVVMDFEAGVEHLGRGTARGVDTLLIVVEPGLWALQCAQATRAMAEEIGVADVRVVVNKVSSPEDIAFVRERLPGLEILATVPYTEQIRQAERHGRSVVDGLGGEPLAQFEAILDALAARG